MNLNPKRGWRMEDGGWKIATLLSAICYLLSSVPICADITATVYPGYTFGADENPTVDTLNLLGLPTISITGTLGGTNVALGAGTVTGTMLADSAVDDVTVGFNASVPRAIYVKNSGIDSNQIAAAFIARPLSGGGGNRLFLLWDSTLTTNASSQLTVSGTNLLAKMVIPSNKLAGGSSLANTGAVVSVGTGLALSNNVLYVTNNWFISTNIPIPTAAGSITNIAHGLGGTPAFVRWVIVCTATEAGYSVGDELDIMQISNGGDSRNWAAGANSTNVFIGKANNTLNLVNKSTGSAGSMTSGGGVYSNWQLKVYCGP